MTALGLSPGQIAERRLHIHAGDAPAIMAGDYRKVFRRIKGLDPEDDLSDEFRVQLGSYTEPFNLAWGSRQTGREIAYYSANALMRRVWNELRPPWCGRPIEQELQISRAYPFMACNLDGMTTTPQGHPAPIDAKHVGRAGEQEILRYTPAGVFQATVMECDWWGLSFIVGNKWEEPVFQEVDPLYQATLIARCRECWSFIERDEEPPEAEVPVLAPKPQPRLRTVVIDGGIENDGHWIAPQFFEDFDPNKTAAWPNWGSNFADALTTIIRTDAAHTANNIARAAVKDLIPDDVGEIRRGDCAVKRDKSGAIRFTLPKKDAGP